MEKQQKPMAEKDKQQRRESTPQAPDRGQNPGERSDKESIDKPVQLDSERPGAERQRSMDREKQPN